jgi:tryptophan synthase alpha chain
VNRIDATFERLRARGERALVVYLTAGDPSLADTRRLVVEMVRQGADVVEIGVPFSDPLADGPVIQRAAARSLAGGTTLARILETVDELRREVDVPLILFGYYNPVYVYPSEAFLDDAKAAGADGLIIVDVPPEADEELCLPAIARGLNFIRLATPTTDDARLPTVLANTSGFLYYVSITGITGTAEPDVVAVHSHIARIKRSTRLPVAVGFGVRTPHQAKAIAAGADGVVVGSALVDAVKKSLGPKGETTGKTASNVLDLVKSLSQALRPA